MKLLHYLRKFKYIPIYIVIVLAIIVILDYISTKDIIVNKKNNDKNLSFSIDFVDKEIKNEKEDFSNTKKDLNADLENTSKSYLNDDITYENGIPIIIYNIKKNIPRYKNQYIYDQIRFLYQQGFKSIGLEQFKKIS